MANTPPNPNAPSTVRYAATKPGSLLGTNDTGKDADGGDEGEGGGGKDRGSVSVLVMEVDVSGVEVGGIGEGAVVAAVAATAATDEEEEEEEEDIEEEEEEVVEVMDDDDKAEAVLGWTFNFLNCVSMSSTRNLANS